MEYPQVNVVILIFKKILGLKLIKLDVKLLKYKLKKVLYFL